MKKIRVFEAFSGYGSQSIALRNLGVDYEVVAISEIDPDAIIAYSVIRDFEIDGGIDIELARKELMDLNIGWDFKKGKSSIPRMKKDKLIKLYSANKFSNNLGDISKINVEDIPEHDLFTYSFPCQDVSVAGLQKGIERNKTRSGLLYECEKVIEHCKPKYLLMENVKNLVGKKFKAQFDEWLAYLSSLGYTNYWKVLNAKDYGIPQNRERVFVVSILGEHKPYEFPETIKLEKCIKDILEDEVDEKYYLSSEMVEKCAFNKNFSTGVIRGRYNQRDSDITNTIINKINQVGRLDIKSNNQISRVFGVNGVSPTLDTMQGGNRQPKIICEQRTDEGLRFFKDNICGTIRTIDAGGDKRIIENNIAIRKLTPRECFRLMGVNDTDIDKIQCSGISNSQQYKLAGNSIVVDVLEGIFRELFLKQIKLK